MSIVEKFLDTSSRELPLFNNTDIGIRFELENTSLSVQQSENQSLERSLELAYQTFSQVEKLILVVERHSKSKRESVRYRTSYFNEHSKVASQECQRERGGSFGGMYRKRVLFNTTLSDLNLNILFRDIIVDGFSTDCRNHRYFIVSEARQVIFHMYDDRGCDIVASTREVLLPLFKRYNSWIFEPDREIINSNLLA